ncbi:MAG: DNA cytosine methyltransferase [Candidatus Thorarchaeota archaeon]
MKSQYYEPNDLKRIGSSLYLKGFVSLCTGGGVGDTGIEQSSTGLRLAVAVEKHRQRARLLQGNFPRARVIQGDIGKRTVKAQVCEAVEDAFGTSRPFAVLMTPPCQGWSPNGQGRLRRNAAWEPESDTRNLIVKHCLEIVDKIHPAVVMFENVPHMRSKEIRLRKRSMKVVDYIRNRLERTGYTVHQSPSGMTAANYGIPQERNRIFIVAERIGLPDGLVFPKPSHINPNVNTNKGDLPHWITLGEVIGPDSTRGDVLLGRLSGSEEEHRQDLDDNLHRIPPVNHDHASWIRDVSPGGTAFDNSVCPKCHYEDPEYDWELDAKCSKCGSTLNKPVVLKKSGPRVIRYIRPRIEFCQFER